MGFIAWQNDSQCAVVTSMSCCLFTTNDCMLLGLGVEGVLDLDNYQADKFIECDQSHTIPLPPPKGDTPVNMSPMYNAACSLSLLAT